MELGLIWIMLALLKRLMDIAVLTIGGIVAILLVVLALAEIKEMEEV